MEEDHLELGVHSDALPPPPLSEGHLQDLPDQLHHGRLGLEHEDPRAGHQELDHVPLPGHPEEVVPQVPHTLALPVAALPHPDGGLAGGRVEALLHLAVARLLHQPLHQGGGGLLGSLRLPDDGRHRRAPHPRRQLLLVLGEGDVPDHLDEDAPAVAWQVPGDLLQARVAPLPLGCHNPVSLPLKALALLHPQAAVHLDESGEDKRRNGKMGKKIMKRKKRNKTKKRKKKKRKKKKKRPTSTSILAASRRPRIRRRVVQEHLARLHIVEACDGVGVAGHGHQELLGADGGEGLVLSDEDGAIGEAGGHRGRQEELGQGSGEGRWRRRRGEG